MRLEHFSRTEITTKIYDKDQKPEASPHGKPRGLWVSDEAADVSWSTWVQGEELDWLTAGYWYSVSLSSRANILCLQSDRDIRNFTSAYSTESWLGAAIDWAKVAVRFDGIVITPYVWSCRLDPKTTWYYGWDCASGCIWNARAIKSLTLKERVQRELV
jgi:hypothetical protein